MHTASLLSVPGVDRDASRDAEGSIPSVDGREAGQRDSDACARECEVGRRQIETGVDNGRNSGAEVRPDELSLVRDAVSVVVSAVDRFSVETPESESDLVSGDGRSAVKTVGRHNRERLTVVRDRKASGH